MASTITKFFKSTTKFIEDHNGDIARKLRVVLSLDDEQYAKMVDAMKVDEITDLKKMGKKCGVTKTRAPTAYNLYVQRKIKELKIAEPAIDRKQLMIMAAASWTAGKVAAAAALEGVEADGVEADGVEADGVEAEVVETTTTPTETPTLKSKRSKKST
jgi:hypothetical protein